VNIAAELARRVVVLDGGLATELERRGADLSSNLWSAQLLRDDPGEIVEAHRAFVEAGAEVATSASYQASFEGLGDDAEQLMRLSVRLARQAAPAWVAASVGPYGAVLADGSEYRGDYGLSVSELRLWHRRRLAVLADAGADVLAVETIPCLAEVEAVCAELSALAVPAWVSVTCSGRRTRAGESAADAFDIAAACPAVIAVGVNCTDPADVGALVPLAARSGKPVVIYPNSGESWDAKQRRWVGPGRFASEDVRSWVDAGARLVGGCCRVRPEDIAALAAEVGPPPSGRSSSTA
jgi:homocysteine S-methyltransferase